jgi:hypothetical protein
MIDDLTIDRPQDSLRNIRGTRNLQEMTTGMHHRNTNWTKQRPGRRVAGTSSVISFRLYVE